MHNADNNLLLATEKIEDQLYNVQIYPAYERVEINDKFTKIIFRRDYTDGKEYKLLEKKSSKVNGKSKSRIITKYSVSSNTNESSVALDEFDRAVLAAIISEQKIGNLYTTINIIFRNLIGKVGKSADGIKPHKNQRAAIINSIKKLMGKIIDFKNLAETLAELGYVDSETDVKLKSSSILPAVLLDCTVNGKFVEDVLYFDRESPLLYIADKKNQIIRYPANLLDVPNQNNTPLIIALKSYIMRRICEIKLHKNLTPTITFDDVFKRCGIADANQRKKFYARDVILKLFAHLKDRNFINSFIKIKQGVTIHSVKFSFDF